MGSGGRFDRGRKRGWVEGRILGCRLSCEDDPGGEIGVVAVDAKSVRGPETLPVAHEVMGGCWRTDARRNSPGVCLPGVLRPVGCLTGSELPCRTTRARGSLSGGAGCLIRGEE